VRVRLRDHEFDVGAAERTGGYWRAVTQGAWEPRTFPIFERFIDREHSYIDLGAYVGVTLLYGCQLARRAYGVEADPIAFPELRSNVEANRPLTDNVQVTQVCIAPRSGVVAFGNCGEGGDTTSSVLFGNRRTHWTVPALSFEDFIRRHGIDDCNFIKMDIEGGEYALLPTMLPYLRAQRPTVHLSLHPCHLGKRRIGWIGKLVARAAATLRIRPCLRLYRHLYDHQGRPVSFARLLWRCLAKVTIDVVLTDQEWNAA
jgi:FkbM family methyltransferase